MYRYALIFAETNTVENVFMWDGETPWDPPVGCTAVPDPDGAAQIGYTYNPNDGSYTPPVITTVAAVTVEQLQSQLAALAAQISALTNQN